MPTDQHRCQCSCGATQFSVRGRPLLRGFCHCTICQEFNQAPFGDISLYRASDVAMPDPGLVEYKAFRPPPAVQRGRCKSCEKPAVEVMKIFPLPELIIVPTYNLQKECVLEPSIHVFYHSRVADIDDDLPKISGYWKSQMAFGQKLVAALMRGHAGG